MGKLKQVLSFLSFVLAYLLGMFVGGFFFLGLMGLVFLVLTVL